MSRFFLQLIVCVLLSLSLGGCNTARNHANVKDLDGTLRPDTSLVFGRLQWVEDGEERVIGSGLVTFSVAPQLVRIDDGKRILGEIDENGKFTWTLEKGMYVINRLNYREPLTGNYSLVPKFGFRVPENGKAYGLGTLRAESTHKRNFMGSLAGAKTKFSVNNTTEADIANFRQRFPGTNYEVGPSLFVYDDRLPHTFDTSADFSLAMQILQAILTGIH
jgi:hypothetical protein